MNLDQLDPEALASLKAQLGINTDDSGRSPIKPRQLNDLRLLPTATDPRPTFFWSAESPRDKDVSKIKEFPKLLWHGVTGEEVTAANRNHQDDLLLNGHVLTAPKVAVVDPAVAAQTRVADEMEAIRAALEALSPEDRTLVIEAQRQQRLAALQQKMAALDDTSLETLLTSAADQAQEPAKRGPGRPKKEAVA